MSKKNQSVFNQIAESLNKVAEELETTNSLLIGLGNLGLDLYDAISEVSKQLQALPEKKLSVTVDLEAVKQALSATTEAEKPKLPTIPKFEFKPEERGE